MALDGVQSVYLQTMSPGSARRRDSSITLSCPCCHLLGWVLVELCQVRDHSSCVPQGWHRGSGAGERVYSIVSRSFLAPGSSLLVLAISLVVYLHLHYYGSALEGSLGNRSEEQEN